MQITQYWENQYREMFEANSIEELIEKMDKRLAELKGEGHNLVTRKLIGRNQPCPCGSGKKSKYCCLKHK